MLERWLNKLEPIHVVETQEEREAVYRFRYDVYYKEFGRLLSDPDHDRKWVHDPEDEKETATILYSGSPDDITGTVRLRHWPPGTIPPGVMSEMSMDRFPDIKQRTVAEIGRFMIRKGKRGKLLLASFSQTTYNLLCGKHEVEFVFCYCAPTLVNYYRKLGARPFGGSMIQTPDDYMVPLVSVVSDYDYYKRAGSPLASLVRRHFGRGKRDPIDIEPYRHLFEDGVEAIETDSEKIWEELQNAVTTSESKAGWLFEHLSEDVINKLTHRGFIMPVEAGAMLIRKGLRQQEMFVILEGMFEVLDGEQQLCQLGKGELFGEVAFFSPRETRIATVRAITEGQVLVLQAQTLRQLIESEPKLATNILLRIAGVMADRLAAANEIVMGHKEAHEYTDNAGT
jgi:hypothetical protein